MFHYTAILILSLYFVRAPIIGLTLMLIFLSFANLLISTYDYLSFATIWLGKLPGQVNFTSSLFIVQATISLSAIYVWKKLTLVQKRGAYFNTIGVIVYLLFNDYPVVAHRVRELTQLGIFPLLFFHKEKLNNVRLIWVAAFCYFIIYNLYMILQEINSKFYVL